MSIEAKIEAKISAISENELRRKREESEFRWFLFTNTAGDTWFVVTQDGGVPKISGTSLARSETQSAIYLPHLRSTPKNVVTCVELYDVQEIN